MRRQMSKRRERGMIEIVRLGCIRRVLAWRLREMVAGGRSERKPGTPEKRSFRPCHIDLPVGLRLQREKRIVQAD